MDYSEPGIALRNEKITMDYSEPGIALRNEQITMDYSEPGIALRNERDHQCKGRQESIFAFGKRFPSRQVQAFPNYLSAAAAGPPQNL